MMYNKEFYKKRYDWVHALLLEFAIGSEEDETNIETIERFISIYDVYYIEKTIFQIKEVLKLDPLPMEWVEDVMRSSPLREREWFEWLAQTLEEEAKKAGKL